MAESFEKTFIREARWELIARGLLVTVELALLSAIFGTLLGFGLCLVRRSKMRGLSTAGNLFCKLISTVPNLVTLMIFYFIIFGSSDLDPVAVCVIAFSVMFSVSVSGVLNSVINAVDAGQWEAASALGFGKVKTFTKIILPQTMKMFFPLYRVEFISMLKLTSIVGYVSVEDLTKAGDIIRSRTYEAFFPLIVSAILYCIIASLIILLIGRIELNFDSGRRKMRLLAGVSRNEIAELSDGGKSTVIPDEIIRIEHLRKEYSEATPIRDMNASVKRGEVITIIGPSGTGKSTLLRCINRLETPTSGNIYVFGENVCDKKTDLIQIRQRMGMVFQSFNLFPHLTIIENVMIAPVLLKKVPKQEAYEYAMSLLKTVGMASRAMQYPSVLSGGQKQRVAIARTLAMNPEIILFDEPTSALDPTMVGEVLSVIRKFSDMGFTMMIVTHEMKFARNVSTRIFYLDQGELYEEGTPEEIFESPKRNRTAAFVKQLKTLVFKIENDSYDRVSMIERLLEFGKNNFMSKKQTDNLQRAFEEITSVLTDSIKSGESVLTVVSDYSEETEEAHMHFIWKGAEYDPTEQEDNLSVKLMKGFLKNMEFRYEGGENRFSVTL